MQISKTDEVIKYNGTNAEEVLAFTEVVQGMETPDGTALFYNDSSDGNPNAKQLPVGAYVSESAVYLSLDGYQYVEEEDATVGEPVTPADNGDGAADNGDGNPVV